MKKQKGFTLIELLVVIAIIGVLSSVLILVIKPSDQINKAKAAKIAKDLKLIEKAFRLTAADDMENYNLYPTEAELGLSNPQIATLVDNGTLKYISRDIGLDLGSGVYRYDNDGDTYVPTNCPGTNNAAGHGILVYSISSSDLDVVNELDSIFDSGNGLNCGLIRTYNNLLIFYLSD